MLAGLSLHKRSRTLLALLLAVIAWQAVPHTAIPTTRTQGTAFSASTADVAVVDRRVAVSEVRKIPRVFPPPFTTVLLPLVAIRAILVVPDSGQQLSQQCLTLAPTDWRPSAPARGPPSV